jgi:predicted nucleotidyltransferase
MFFSEDMKDLLAIFERREVTYALVGGFAVNYYGYPRFTQDIDFLVYPSRENAEKIKQAMTEFGFGNAGIPFDLFEKEGSAIHLGVEPNRIDMLTHLQGIGNEQIFQNRKRVELQGIQVNMISLEDLIRVKRRSQRLKDQADAEALENASKQQP